MSETDSTEIDTNDEELEPMSRSMSTQTDNYTRIMQTQTDFRGKSKQTQTERRPTHRSIETQVSFPCDECERKKRLRNNTSILCSPIIVTTSANENDDSMISDTCEVSEDEDDDENDDIENKEGNDNENNNIENKEVNDHDESKKDNECIITSNENQEIQNPSSESVQEVQSNDVAENICEADGCSTMDESFISEHADDTDDPIKDPDYIPEEDTQSSDEYEIEDTEEIDNVERCFLVYESELNQLFKRCPKCGGASSFEEIKVGGSLYKVSINCSYGCLSRWQSQPYIKACQGVGNLELTTAITLAGIPHKKFEEFAKLLDLKFFHSSTFYDLRKKYVRPTVIEFWDKEKNSVIASLKSSGPVTLIGDGRCDSPGHSAKYGTYTFMSADSGKVVDTVVVPVTEVSNSNAMEKEGFKRLLLGLLDLDVEVTEISTDRHGQIRKEMKQNPKFKKITHSVDPWHVIKGIKKKLNAKAKKKDFEIISKWVESVINHFWWSLETCNGKPEELVERFQSIIYHVINKHRWPGASHFKKCAHGKLDQTQARKMKWMVAGSPAHEEFKKIIMHYNVREDLMQMANGVNTTLLEVYHNMMSKYLPKIYHFQYDHMEMGTMLSALDNNYNTNRAQKVTVAPSKTGIGLIVKKNSELHIESLAKGSLLGKSTKKRSMTLGKT